MANESLSFEALGVLTFARCNSSLPLTVSLLMARGCKEHTARRILRELVRAGFVRAEQLKGSDGRFTEAVYGLIDFVGTEEINGTDEKFGTEEKYRTEDFSAPVEGARVPEGARAHAKSLKPKTKNKDKNTAPDGAARSKSADRPKNDWYDAVQEVWGYHGALNGAMVKMLQGRATAAAWRDGNVEVPLTPDDVRRWAAWYRATELRGDDSLNMLEDRMKIASSLAAWDARGRPGSRAPTVLRPVFVAPPVSFEQPSPEERAAFLAEARAKIAGVRS